MIHFISFPVLFYWQVCVLTIIYLVYCVVYLTFCKYKNIDWSCTDLIHAYLIFFTYQYILLIHTLLEGRSSSLIFDLKKYRNFSVNFLELYYLLKLFLKISRDYLEEQFQGEYFIIISSTIISKSFSCSCFTIKNGSRCTSSFNFHTSLKLHFLMHKTRCKEQSGFGNDECFKQIIFIFIKISEDLLEDNQFLNYCTATLNKE